MDILGVVHALWYIRTARRYLHARDLRSHDSKEKSQASSKGDWQHGASIQTRQWSLCQRSLPPLRRPTLQNAHILACRSNYLYIRRRGLWLPIPALHDIHTGVRGSIPLLLWHSRSYIPGTRRRICSRCHIFR